MQHTSTKLNSLAGLAHGFFGRKGGVSEGLYASLNCGAGSQDAPENVVENKRRIAQTLGAETLITLAQVHSANVVTIVQPAKGIQTHPHQADAMVTNERGVALGILTADCGPVLFADAKAGVIGAAHAGWKGAHTGVLENTIAAMEKLGASRAHITAALGPTIAQQSYEVGEAFRANIVSADAAYDRFFTPEHYFDLPAYIRHRLWQAGLQHVDDVAIDTYAQADDYFSFRRSTHNQEPDYGRQLSAVMLA